MGNHRIQKKVSQSKSSPINCLLKIEEKGQIIMPTIKEAIIMIKNAWKQVKLYFIIFSIVYKCISVFNY